MSADHSPTPAPQPTPTFRESDCDVTDPDVRPKGGQHTGLTSSAVMVRHRPTGFSATCREHRSQLRNKTAAMQELREMVDSLYERHPDDQ